jgi:beta-phosphoglucomutase
MALLGSIFDLDGVIVDTAKYHYQAWKRLAEELGVDFTKEENEKLKGVSRMRSLEIILEMGGVEASEEEKLELATRKNTWFVEHLNNMSPDEILPGVMGFLEQLKSKGIKIALGSASKNARRALENIKMVEKFEVIIDGTMVSKAKPDPEVFIAAVNGLGLSPDNCIVFEDAVAGVEAAHNGGMKCIGVGDPQILREAEIVISTFENLSWDELTSQLQNS